MSYMYNLAADLRAAFKFDSKLSNPDHETVELRLTPRDAKKLDDSIRSELVDKVPLVEGVDVDTKHVHFTSVVIPFMLRMVVVSSDETISTATHKGKTICINSH